MTPLYNHTSEETAYLIADYPYGFKLRCQMKVWLEHKPSQGWRMVTRTSNPKKPGHWNAPKMSTYCALGGNLFLDNEGHIHWDGVSPYADLAKLESFAARFPESDLTLINAFIKRYQFQQARVAEAVGTSSPID